MFARAGEDWIFNRSYYEEVLIVRVHKEILARQKIPPSLVWERIWDERLADITHFEDYLTRQGVVILKFFLQVSREEQKSRFLNRLNSPEKNWKLSASDVHERRFWSDFAHTKKLFGPPDLPCSQCTAEVHEWKSRKSPQHRCRLIEAPLTHKPNQDRSHTNESTSCSAIDRS